MDFVAFQFSCGHPASTHELQYSNATP